MEFIMNDWTSVKNSTNSPNQQNSNQQNSNQQNPNQQKGKKRKRIFIEVDSQSFIRGKFHNTLTTLAGYLQEVKQDVSDDRSYGPETVQNRMEKIQAILMQEIDALAKSTTMK
jgi:hypothetical protein